MNVKITIDASKVLNKINTHMKLAETSSEIKTSNFLYFQTRTNINDFRKTGALYKSYKQNRKTGDITSNSVYAVIQNYGGQIRITEKMRAWAWRRWYETKQSVYRGIALTKKTHVTIPAKNYIEFRLSEIRKNKVARVFKDALFGLKMKDNN